MMIKESLRLFSSRSMIVRAMPAVRSVSVRSFTGNTKVLDEKEKGDERLFFKRQEGRPNFEHSFRFLKNLIN